MHFDDEDYSMEMVKDGGYWYLMKAARGSTMDQPVWQIKRIVGSTSAGEIVWAEGSNDFRFIANNYSTFTYK